MNLNYEIFNKFIKNIPCPDNKIHSCAFLIDNKNLKLSLSIINPFSNSFIDDIQLKEEYIYNNVSARIDDDIKKMPI